MRLTTAFKAFGRDGRSGPLDVVGVEVAVVVAVGLVAAVLVMVDAAVFAAGAGKGEPDQISIRPIEIDIIEIVNRSSDLPPAVAPALSHGLGGETDAMELRERGCGLSLASRNSTI